MKRALLEELIAWKDLSEHLPILLRGARQVGKSYLVEHFGNKYFNDIAIVDFENRPEFKSAFKTRDPKDILAGLEIALNKPIKAGQSLLFLDEIQLCPEALISLRYFKEQMPQLHVIAAGSLLEFILKDENFGFPVGRVEFLYLRPLSFHEYLDAAAPFILQKINAYNLSRTPTQLEHTELLKWVRRYMFVGGMPSAVKTSLINDSLFDSQRVHYRILQAYESDFGKYAKHTQHKYLQMVFQKAPALVGQILKYSRIDEQMRSRELKQAIELLCHAGLFQRIVATTASGLPLHAHQKIDRYKLLYLDIGLLQTETKVDATHFFEQEIMQINAGMLAEQFVGQELLAYAPAYQNAPLLFWERTNGGQAEIDFVMEIGSDIIPVEVKAGSTGTLRSLHSFMQGKEGYIGVRISENPLSLYNNILSVPFYLVNSLKGLVREARLLIDK
ncbi:MAG: ATP-binding protein [Candidatus Protochlamydia sp.]|nr:ATP-binding protein [Candidatus Protochlamydia sp.]